MSTPVEIKDPESGNTARVTKYGQLVTAPLTYSTPVKRSLTSVNTAFNFVEPSQGQNIIITDIIVSADKNVSANTPANVLIYSSDGIDSLTSVNDIFGLEIGRGTSVPVTGLNFITNKGVWLNAVTDDNNILLTIAYYYVPEDDI